MKLICFDCDSTQSSIEGIDELARLRGPEVFARVEAMTRDAMDGKIPIGEVFGRRLEIIRPGRTDVDAVGARYLETAEPTAAATVAALRARGWTPLILSGGFRQAIEPLARRLGIARVEAVDLYFSEDGSYKGFDTAFPSTRNGGKREVIESLRAELGPERVVMVGDGVSDMESLPAADFFVGFGGYVAREKVRQGAGAFITSLAQLAELL